MQRRDLTGRLRLQSTRVETRQGSTHPGARTRERPRPLFLFSRSAKETVLDLVGRSLEDALRLEAINGYSSVGDISEAREGLARFFGRGERD